MADTLRLPRAVALLVVGALALAACDDDGSTAQGIDTLGDDFVRAFNQDPNDEPLDASELTLTLTPTIEPFDP
jgi:hypothetical protein